MKINERKKAANVVLGIDYGDSNIGLAFGRDGYVSPIGIVSNTSHSQAIKEISRIALENKIDKIVIGLPITADGKETKQSMEIRQFTKLLKGHLSIKIEFMDEYDTSKEAIKASIEMGQSQKQRRAIDDLSAAIILKRYFDENPSPSETS